MLYLYQGGDNISDFGGLFMVWLTKSKFLSLSLTPNEHSSSIGLGLLRNFSMIPILILFTAMTYFGNPTSSIKDIITFSPKDASADVIKRPDGMGGYLLINTETGEQSVYRPDGMGGGILIPGSPKYDSNKEYHGRTFESLMTEGHEAYQNRAFARAEDVFRYVAQDLRPGNVDAKIWTIKSRYMEHKSEGDLAKAQELALVTAKRYSKVMPGNRYLKQLVYRLGTGCDISKFTKKAWELDRKAWVAYNNGDNKLAANFYKQSLEIDPHNTDAWEFYGSAKARQHEGPLKEKKDIKISIMQRGLVYNPTSVILIQSISETRKL